MVSQDRAAHRLGLRVQQASWRRLAENNGFDYALTPGALHGVVRRRHTSTSRRRFSLALLLATERLKVIAAVHPGMWHPGVLAKFVATADHMTNGRAAVNVVSGWFKGEFVKLGEHVARARRALPPLPRSSSATSARSGPTTTPSSRGDFYQPARLRPEARSRSSLEGRPHPEIFQGGNSGRRRRRWPAGSATGTSPTATPPTASPSRSPTSPTSRRRRPAARVQFGVNGFMVARDTEAEAHATLEEIIAKADRRGGRGLRRRGQAGRPVDRRQEGHVAGLRLPRPRPVQRRLPHRPGRHARADRAPDRSSIKRRGVEPVPARLPALPGGGRVLRREGAADRPRARGRGSARRASHDRSGCTRPVASPSLHAASEAVSVARTLAAHFAEGAAQRDAERILPGRELDRLSESGCSRSPSRRSTAAPELPAVTLAEVFRILATGDPSIAQIPQSHFVYVNAMREQGTPAQQEFFFGEVLAGKRFGNAQSEVGTKHVRDIRTTLTPATATALAAQRHQGLRHRRALRRLDPGARPPRRRRPAPRRLGRAHRARRHRDRRLGRHGPAHHRLRHRRARRRRRSPPTGSRPTT